MRPRQGPGRPVKKATFNVPQYKVVETSSIQPKRQSQDQSTIEKSPPPIFNTENELERVKIPIPFSELSRNPSYKQQVSKWIQYSSLDVEGDVISL